MSDVLLPRVTCDISHSHLHTEDMFTRCLKVLSSCETLPQLNAGVRYLDIAYLGNHISYSAYISLLQYVAIKSNLILSYIGEE